LASKKIALVGFHLSGGGGARVMANLSNFFAGEGFDIHNIILHDELGFEYSGELFNLGKLKSKQNTIFNKIKRFFRFRRYIKQQDFDLIIDFRFRKRILQEYLISRYVYKRDKTIYTIHSSKLDVYLPKSKFWAKVIYGKCKNLITLTKEMKNKVEHSYPFFSNVRTIYNPVNPNLIQKKAQDPIDFNLEFVVAAGTYDKNTKQFDKLIEAYANSTLPQEQIHLLILGKGKLLEQLKAVALQHQVNALVHFIGFQENSFKYFSKAKYFVLSSKFEGLPMVLIEALTSGTPVVSFDCKTGPNEIIQHEQNGLLVEDQNVSALSSNLTRLIKDEALYKQCKGNALSSVEPFTIQNVGREWLSLINTKS
jgi:N-acetylgalactosamine-N,N'-diacetylbacillosaminyl-diphospho-undecaprenol 4-alpha-N-acetylgalactosaminyltransferase